MRLTENYKLQLEKHILVWKAFGAFTRILREPNSSEQSYLMDYFVLR